MSRGTRNRSREIAMSAQGTGCVLCDRRTEAWDPSTTTVQIDRNISRPDSQLLSKTAKKIVEYSRQLASNRLTHLFLGCNSHDAFIVKLFRF